MTIIKAFNEAVKGQISKIDLGSFESVMVSNSCKAHPQMFRRIYGPVLDASSPRAFLIYFSPWSIFIALIPVGDGLLAGFELRFLSVPSIEDTPFITNLVDSHWIDHNLFRRWRGHCDSQSNGICHVGRANAQLAHNRPAWLIGTWRLCLTPGDNQVSYVALSYV